MRKMTQLYTTDIQPMSSGEMRRKRKLTVITAMKIQDDRRTSKDRQQLVDRRHGVVFVKVTVFGIYCIVSLYCIAGNCKPRLCLS